MCNGRWLMRDRRAADARRARAARGGAAARPRASTRSSSSREVSVLQKLVAVGGAVEQESFEVQVKARVPSAEHGAGGDRRRAASRSCDRATTTSTTPTGRSTIPDQGWLRYREDEFLDEAGKVTGARARLTLTGRTREEDRFGAVLLSRSRYYAPATHSARFYREYFRPAARTDRRKGSAPLAGRLPRRRVLRAPRSADEPAARRLLHRGQVAHLVAARRARQGGGHHRAARAVRRQSRRHASATATPSSPPARLTTA